MIKILKDTIIIPALHFFPEVNLQVTSGHQVAFTREVTMFLIMFYIVSWIIHLSLQKSLDNEIKKNSL